MIQSIHKSTRMRNREIRHMISTQNATVSIGKLSKNFDIFCLNKGQYSIINVIEHVLNEIGAADVVISTWTAADAEITKAFQFLNNTRINKLHWIVDRSFPTRQAKYYDSLIKKFGQKSVSMTNSHAKFVLISNDSWKIVIRTSMNLNENKRLEFFEMSDDENLFAYLLELSKDIINSGDYDFAKFKLLGHDEKYSKYAQIDDIDIDFDFKFELENHG